MPDANATSAALKVAIVGCGKIADAHVAEIRNSGSAELVAVCDIEPVLAAQLADRFAIPRRYDKLDDMLAAERLDVVHIITPPGSHLAITQACTHAGAHIFIEKPVAFDGAGTDRILEVAQVSGRKLSVNYWLNFELCAQKLKAMIAAGELGDIVHLESWYGYDLGGQFGQALLNDPEHWVHKMPGRLFQNVLDHVVSRIVPLLPADDAEVHAHAFRRRASTGTPTADALLDELRVHMRSGSVTAYCTFSAHVKPLENFLRVYGTEGSAEVNYGLRTVRRFQAQTQPSAIGRLLPLFSITRQDWHEAWRNVREFRRYQSRYFYGMGQLLEHFYDSVRGARELPIPYAHISRTAHIMDAIHAQVYGSAPASQPALAGSMQ